MQKTYYYQARFGWIRLTYQEDLLVLIDLSPEISDQSELLSSQKTLYQPFISYLETFNSTEKPKNLLQGSTFQQKVWRALNDIKAGTTVTYTELAKKLNSHPRAVGQALKRNPLPLLYPCHRVVSQSGIGGFAGKTEGKLIDLKRWLLHHEANIK